MLALVLSLAARAHPFEAEIYGHQLAVSMGPERIDLVLVAEVPTRPLVAEMRRFLGPDKQTADETDSARFTEDEQNTIASGLSLEVDGTKVPWHRIPDAATSGVGDARFVTFTIHVDAALAPGPHALRIRDDSFPDLPGVYRWTVSVAEPLAISSSLYDVANERLAKDRTDDWHADERFREATFTVEADDGLEARLDRKIAAWSGKPSVPMQPGRERLAGVHANPLAVFLEGKLDGRVVALGLFLSVVLGALHAFSPGHGRTLVAAYLLGPRQTIRHAFWLALIVTITHTASVAALGLGALLLFEGTDPAALLPWTELVSGLIVAIIGARILWARMGHEHEHATGDADSHEHARHVHHHGAHPAEEEAHAAEHARAIADAGAHWRSVVALGLSGGLVPCPGAMVILLTALSLHRVGFGLVLVGAFSLGLGLVLFALGAIIVTVGGRARPRTSFGLTVLPIVGAVLVTGIGIAITFGGARAVLSAEHAEAR